MISENRKVANEKDLKEGGLLRVELDGTPIVLAKVNGSIYAVDATCTHQGGPLDEGKLEGHDLTCPWHYAVFDVRNGKVSDKTVWATNLNSYTVQVDKKSGDISLGPQPVARQGEEAVRQKGTDNKQKYDADALERERQFYQEEERKATDKLTLELISKEKLEGTDMMTFKFSRAGLDFLPG
ncbi:MAG TPA: Rieske 2Fe-2S domain-containing protein, partial [Nitrososphaera sp.]|nr:Rieske 2Fe-2S domain-containing protein [Nitrososphaera sp.]